jgi:hypothetical protein
VISTVVQPASTSRFSPVCLKMAGPRPYPTTPFSGGLRVVEREEAFCLDAINAIGDYTEARRRWAEDHPVDAGQHFRRMGADGRLLPDEWRPPAHQKSARELYEREIAKITGDDPWAVKMRAQTRRYYHIDETHIDDLADDPADEGQP